MLGKVSTLSSALRCKVERLRKGEPKVPLFICLQFLPIATALLIGTEHLLFLYADTRARLCSSSSASK